MKKRRAAILRKPMSMINVQRGYRLNNSRDAHFRKKKVSMDN